MSTNTINCVWCSEEGYLTASLNFRKHQADCLKKQLAKNYFLVEEMEEKRLNKEQMGQAIDVRMADLKLLVDQHYGHRENTDQSTTQNIQTAVIIQNVDINAPTNFVFQEGQAQNVEAIEDGGNEQSGWSNRKKAAKELLETCTTMCKCLKTAVGCLSCLISGSMLQSIVHSLLIQS